MFEILHWLNPLWICYRPWSNAKQGDNVFGSVCLFVRPSALSQLNALTYDLDVWHVGWHWPWLGWDCRSRSNSKNAMCFDMTVTFLYGQGQRSWSNFWCAAVDFRGSALPSTTKSKEESLSVHLVWLCIARMRSIGF